MMSFPVPVEIMSAPPKSWSEVLVLISKPLPSNSACPLSPRITLAPPASMIRSFSDPPITMSSPEAVVMASRSPSEAAIDDNSPILPLALMMAMPLSPSTRLRPPVSVIASAPEPPIIRSSPDPDVIVSLNVTGAGATPPPPPPASSPTFSTGSNTIMPSRVSIVWTNRTTPFSSNEASP